MMHGFGNGGGCFWRNVASFGALGRTHLVDWRGAGMSGRPRSFPPRTYEECVEYFVDGLEAWRRERLGETTKMCLVGHSMGAMIATYYARRHPDRVSHLILTGPASMKDDSDPAKLADFLQGSLLRRFMFNVASLAWRLGFTPQDFARWLPGNTALRFGAGYSLRRWRAGDVLDEEGTLKLARYVTGVVCMPGCSEKVMSVFLKPIGRANKSLASVVEHELDVAIRDVRVRRAGLDDAEERRGVHRRHAGGDAEKYKKRRVSPAAKRGTLRVHRPAQAVRGHRAVQVAKKLSIDRTPCVYTCRRLRVNTGCC